MPIGLEEVVNVVLKLVQEIKNKQAQIEELTKKDAEKKPVDKS